MSEQRMKEGVDSKLDVTKSQLLIARIRLRIAEAEGQSDVLRQHLASLLGVPADSIAVGAWLPFPPCPSFRRMRTCRLAPSLTVWR